MMRVLTVRQPWAAAIFHQAKDVENRTRNLAGSYRGPVAIHVAQKVDADAWDDLEAGWSLTPGVPRPSITDIGHMQRDHGRIIGVVQLTGVHDADSCLSADDGIECSPWGDVDDLDTWHLMLENPQLLETPIPFTGGLGLRNLDPVVEQQILGQLQAVTS